MGILVWSDVVPPLKGPNAYMDGKIEAMLSPELLDAVKAAEWNIVNLECPLTNAEQPVSKWGSSLKAAPESIALLKRIPYAVVNLANNHIRDYGDKGVKDTIRLLDDSGIPYLGAGSCAASVRRTLLLPMRGAACCNDDAQVLNLPSGCGDEAVESPFSPDKAEIESGRSASDGRVLGIFTAAEHEFSAAGERTAGAAAVDEEDILTIRELAGRADYVIALYHGGEEFYPYPTPGERCRLRAWAQAGADLIVCQHNHCISCAENVGSSIIVYGQGNFLFGERPEVETNISDHHAWEHGMIVETLPESVKAGESLSKSPVRYHFYHREGGMLMPDEKPDEENAFRERSRRLSEEGFVVKSWRMYCNEHKEYARIFQKDFGGSTLPLLSRLKRGAAAAAGADVLPVTEYFRIYDYLSCESHLEILRTLCEMEMEKTE